MKCTQCTVPQSPEAGVFTPDLKEEEQRGVRRGGAEEEGELICTLLQGDREPLAWHFAEYICSNKFLKWRTCLYLVNICRQMNKCMLIFLEN